MAMPTAEHPGTVDDDRGRDDLAETSGGRSRRPGRELALDAAVVFGLAAVAVTQPLLDLFGRNPTFFVAGGYGRRQIVAFAVVITLVPGLAVWIATTLPGLVHRSVGLVLHRLRVAALAGLFALVVARSLKLDGLGSAIAFAVVVGSAAALAEARWRPVRQFLGYLALANVVLLGLFLFGSPTTALLRGASYADQGSVQIPALQGPVMVVVLDEFPLAPIVRPDGTINEVRYPNLAALAEESTWFRNASTESSFTAYSVPSILTGLAAGRPDLPILSDFPRNYFTLFGRSYPVRRYEMITDLCPPDACGRPPGQPLSQALEDASIVYRHRVLPEPWRHGLPPVDESWGGFGESPGGAAGSAGSPSSPGEAQGPNDLLDTVPKEDRTKTGQLGILLREAQSVGPDPSISFVHVLLPHTPYVLTPWGTVGIESLGQGKLPEPGEPGYDRYFAELHALQSLQIGAVDRAIGEIVEHLKSVGAWRSGTFVLLSDHGRTTSVPGNGRDFSEEVQDELLRIPLFVKAPGQVEGEVRDEPASTIDVLPSLVDILDIETDWEFEGHSLFDGSEPTVERRVTSDLDALRELVRWQHSFFPHGEDWVSLAAIGPHGDLVGTTVSDHRIGGPSELSWSLDHREALDDPSSTDGRVPVFMTGTVGGHGERPPDLVVALDGRIAGTIGVHGGGGDEWTFGGILGPPGARGQGEDVVAFEVERDGGEVVLHPVEAV